MRDIAKKHTSEWHTRDANLEGLWSGSFDSEETLKESVGMSSVIEGRTIDILGLQRCAYFFTVAELIASSLERVSTSWVLSFRYELQ